MVLAFGLEVNGVGFDYFSEVSLWVWLVLVLWVCLIWVLGEVVVLIARFLGGS